MLASLTDEIRSTSLKRYGLFINISLILLIFAEVGTANDRVAIIDWHNTRTNDHDLMFLVEMNETITFSVNATGAEEYEWLINKVDQGNNAPNLTWTIPNKKGIWEIHVNASNPNGEAHKEWVVSTLNASEAPDIFDYFTDGKMTNRTELDPWDRPLLNWSAEMDASKFYLTSPTNTLIWIPSTIGNGTWIFKQKYVGPGYQKFIPFYTSNVYFEWNDGGYDTHHHMVVKNSTRGEDFSIEYDCNGPSGGDYAQIWATITIIRKDNWIYVYYKKGDNTTLLDSYVYDPGLNESWIRIQLQQTTPNVIFDCLEVYKDRYFFPVDSENIVYDQYIYLEKADEYYLTPQYKYGIIIRGTNRTLSDINSSIANSSLFIYYNSNKTAYINTNLYIDSGSELIIKNETLIFNSNMLEFAPGYGSTLRIENSTITAKDYFIWNFPSGTTYLGYPITLKYTTWSSKPYNKRYNPLALEWGSYGRIFIKNSIISNSSHFFILSPYEMVITNTKFTNLREVDIGNYTLCWNDPAQYIKDRLKGNKSFFIETDDLNIKDFILKNVSLTGISSPLNITFNLNAHRDKLNIYDVDLQNENIKIDCPVAKTPGQSHSAYVGGSANVWGKVYVWDPWASNISSEIGLVNCRFNDIYINSTPCYDAGGNFTNKSVLVKYYLDVLVQYPNGTPVEGANVSVSVEQNWNYDDRKTNHDPVENMVTTYPYATGNWRAFYHHYRTLIGQQINYTFTEANGHTPLPNNTTHTLIITDYKKYLKSSGNIDQINFTYTITASKGNYTGQVTGIDPDPSWYRLDPNIYQNTIVIIIGQKTNYTFNLSAGWNLISLPILNSTMSAENLANIIDNKNAQFLLRRDPVTGGYKSYIVGFSGVSDNFAIEPDHGYYVYVKNATSFTIQGIVPEGRSVNLTKGWNLIGWTSLNSSNAISAFVNPLGSNVKYVTRRNATTGEYQSYIVGVSGPEDNFPIEPGNGYYVYVQNNCTLTYGG